MKFTRFGLKLFFLFLLVSLIPSGIAGVIVYKYVHSMTKENILGQLRYKAYDLSEKLNLLLSKRRIRVADFSSDGFIRDCVEQLSSLPVEDGSSIREKLNHHLIINKKDLDPDIYEIEILDHKGGVLASTSQEQIGRDKSHEDYFRAPFLYQEQKGLYFSGVLNHSDIADETLSLVFSSILTDKHFHKPLGVLITKVKGEILYDLLGGVGGQSGNEGPVGEEHSGGMYIVSSDMLMIAGSGSTEDFSFGEIVDTMQVRKTLASKGEISGIYENHRGVKTFCTALYVSEADWVIVSEKGVKSAFVPLERVKYVFLIAGGVALLLIFTIAVITSNSVSVDLRYLLKGIRRVAAGNLRQPIRIGKVNDEFGEVGESFNLMMNKLRESYESNFQLKSLDRMKDNIIRDVSHELKSPLAQLRLALEIWFKRLDREAEEAESDKKEDGDHFVKIIRDNITRLNHTVESILNLADIESGIESDNFKHEREPVSLRVLITQVVVGQRLVAEKENLLLTSTFSNDLSPVLIDENQIIRVLSNLIDNAIKYTESGEINISAVGKRDSIEVAIKDTGIGIDLPENSQHQVFERFYQKNASSQGIGVGLSICEKIINAHDGKIWVESEGRGTGSTFKFTLPVH